MDALVVGDIALKVADGDGFFLEAEGVDTLALTLLLLRTDATTDCGELAGLTDDTNGLKHLTFLDELDEGRDMNADRATLDTAGIRAV